MAPDPAILAQLLDSMPTSTQQCSERDAAAVAYSLAMAANQLRSRNIFHLQQSPQDALLFCPINPDSDVSVIDPSLQTLVLSGVKHSVNAQSEDSTEECESLHSADCD